MDGPSLDSCLHTSRVQDMQLPPANLLTIAQFGNMIGYFVTGFMGDWIGMRKWYFTSILIAQIIVFPLFFAGIKSAWLIGLLLFFNQLFGQGVSGLAPRWCGGR